MKKVSTVAAKRSPKISEQKLTVGLDLGDRSSWYCMLEEAGSIVVEQKLSTPPKAMKEAFGAMPNCRIALETGMHSPWVSRQLSELGHEVIVAHARSVRLIGESRKKDDRMDAQTLARLARRTHKADGWVGRPLQTWLDYGASRPAGALDRPEQTALLLLDEAALVPSADPGSALIRLCPRPGFAGDRTSRW